MPQVLIRNMVNLQSVPASALWSAAHNATATVNLQSLLFSLLPSFAPHVSLIKLRNMVNLQSVPASALWSAAHNATATVNLQSLLFSLLPSFAPHVSLIKFTLNKNHLLSLKAVTKNVLFL